MLLELLSARSTNQNALFGQLVLLVAKCLSGFTHFVIPGLVHGRVHHLRGDAVDDVQRDVPGAPGGAARAGLRRLRRRRARFHGRGLHSSTLQLILSASYGIGGARRGCVARVKGVLRGV